MSVLLLLVVLGADDETYAPTKIGRGLWRSPAGMVYRSDERFTGDALRRQEAAADCDVGPVTGRSPQEVLAAFGQPADSRPRPLRPVMQDARSAYDERREVSRTPDYQFSRQATEMPSSVAAPERTQSALRIPVSEHSFRVTVEKLFAGRSEPQTELSIGRLPLLWEFEKADDGASTPEHRNPPVSGTPAREVSDPADQPPDRPVNALEDRWRSQWKLEWVPGLGVLTVLYLLVYRLSSWRPKPSRPNPTIEWVPRQRKAARMATTVSAGSISCPYCSAGPLRIAGGARYCRCPKCDEIIERRGSERASSQFARSPRG